MEIKFQKTDLKHLDQALQLFLDEYDKERQRLPYLPNKDLLLNKFKKRLRELFEKGIGITVFKQGQLIGYLIGYPVDELFNEKPGIYVPLYGHSTINNSKKEIYQELYKKAAEIWVEENYLTHAVTLFPYDKDVINTFFWLEFGLRCLDSIRKVELVENNINENIEIKKANVEDIKLMSELYRKDNLYYGSSPLFMPIDQNVSIDNLKEWFEKDNHHLWMAFRENKLIGYIRIEPKGETVISQYSKMMNVTGAFIDEKYRNQKIGKALLNEVLLWLKEKNYQLCGVDFESFNISGSNFWNKYFEPYTYSVVRNIIRRC